MNKIFCIYCRYEIRDNKGKTQFTDWFRNYSFKTESEAIMALDKLKELSKPIDKSTKLKHEFEIRALDETLILQPRLHRPKGRPQKISNDVLNVIISELKNNGIYKIPENIKYQLYNDEDSQKFISKHFTDNWVRYWYDSDKVLYAILKTNDEQIYT
jgi:hypothetical protein